MLLNTSGYRVEATSFCPLNLSGHLPWLIKNAMMVGGHSKEQNKNDNNKLINWLCMFWTNVFEKWIKLSLKKRQRLFVAAMLSWQPVSMISKWLNLVQSLSYMNMCMCCFKYFMFSYKNPQFALLQLKSSTLLSVESNLDTDYRLSLYSAEIHTGTDNVLVWLIIWVKCVNMH